MPLPPPEIEVTTTSTGGDVSVDISIRRDGANTGKARQYHGEGKTYGEAIKDTLKKVFDDPVSGEFIRR